jgi:hypothetical protein
MHSSKIKIITLFSSLRNEDFNIQTLQYMVGRLANFVRKISLFDAGAKDDSL